MVVPLAEERSKLRAWVLKIKFSVLGLPVRLPGEASNSLGETITFLFHLTELGAVSA